jgi:ABC-2 type transport system permease protein
MNPNTSPYGAVALSGSRLFGAYLAETRFEFLRMLRNPAYAPPMLLLPVGLYLLFAVLIAGEAIAKEPEVGTYLFAGFAVMAVSMPALFGIGPTLALEREIRLHELRRAQPAPAGAWLVAKIAVGIAYGGLSLLPMLIAGVATGKLSLGGAQLVAMSLALLSGAIPFCALGLLIGSFLGGSAAPAWANLIYLPGCYLSGMFFPLPESLHWQAPFWPQFHIDQLAMHAAGVEKFQFVPLQLSIAVLLGFSVATSAAALWRLTRKG